MRLLRQAQVVFRIDANLQWEVLRDPETGRWIGICRPLNLNAAGDTWTDFLECVSEAIELLLEELFKKGELPAFLQRQGWRPVGPIPQPGKRIRWDVPFRTHQVTRSADLVPA